MLKNPLLAFSLALLAATRLHAQEIAPNANLRAEGVPPIPAARAASPRGIRCGMSCSSRRARPTPRSCTARARRLASLPG
jgi:hypothetical protein